MWSFAIGAVLILFCHTGESVDLTLVPGANGSDVVQACIAKITQSAIFSIDDQQMLRRIAYVETRDGMDRNTYIPSTNHGGIWQVSESKYLATKNTSNAQLQRQIQGISSSFRIDWLATKWSDLRKPFFSALAARLYLQVITTPIPLASSLSSQGSYWALYYTSSRGIQRHYVSAVNRLHELENCTTNSLDLFFVMDASGSVGHSNFQIMKSFVYNITNSFEVSPERVQVGVMSYATSNAYHFHLNRYSTKAAILTAINNLPYSGGSTNTASALDGTRLYAFTEANGARPISQAVPRIAIVITDGMSNSFTATVRAAKALHDAGIIAFAVGIAGARQTELNAIASEASYVSFISSFNLEQLKALQIAISQESCVASPNLPLNQKVNDDVGPNQTKYLSYPILNGTGITINLNVTNGSVIIYGSTVIPTPNEAFHDFKITTKDFEDIFIDPEKFEFGRRLYLAILGQDPSNEFQIDANRGDTSTDPVMVYSSVRHDIVKRHGQTINITCTAIGKPRPVITWFKNGALVDNNRVIVHSTVINATAIESMMIIRSGQSSDDGVYSCAGANRIPEKGIVVDSKSFILCVINSNTSYLPFLNMSRRASILDNVLDHYVPIGLPSYIAFAGRAYYTLFISSHGLISFGFPFGDYIPRLFPISIPVVAPFWDDSDLRGIGYATYEIITSLNDKDNIINTTANFLKVSERVIVNPNWVLVSRWINVCPFQNSFCRTPPIKPNTFQVVLVSQGTVSYAIFTYKCGDFEWTDRGATVGYSGSSSFYYNHPFSGTADITKIDCLGDPGSIWTNYVFNINI